MATQIVELTGDEAALLRSLDKVIQKQLDFDRKLRDTGEQGDAAGVKLQDALAKVAAEGDKALNGLLRELKSLGPEGSTAAGALKNHLTDAGKAGHRSIDQVLEQIRLIDPEAAEAAAQAKAAFVDAAQVSELEFSDVLDELRQMGPAGRQAADEIKQQLVASGKIAERSMHDVVAQLEKLDPEAAKAARSIVTNMDDAGKKSTSAFVSFGRSAVAELASVVTAYIGVQEAIQLVTSYMEKQRDILRETKDTQLELAKSQQEAAKNLAGLTIVERNSLLRDAVPDIAAAAGFSDVAEITQALGAVASAGESNPDQIRNAVQQAARIERLTPERLDTTAAASSAVQRQAGLDDIRQAIALVETTGTQARITNPQQLVDSLPKAVGSLVSTVPQQNPEIAAREAAALFAQITQGGNDEQGRSSATFAIDFGTRLDKFFTGLADEQIQARSKIELIDRKIGKGTDTEADRQKKDRLGEFLAASEGLEDPATLFGRLGVLQGNEALQKQFVGEGFGEKQFQTALKDLLEPTSALAGALKQSFEVIQASSEFFEREAGQLTGATPQLALARAQADLEAANQAKQIANTEGATLQSVRDIVGETLGQTAPNFIDYATNFAGRGGLAGSTAAEEALSGIMELRTRADQLASDGISGDDALNIKLIEDQITNLVDLVRGQTAAGALSPEGVERARRRAQSGLGEGSLGGPQFSEVDRQLFRDMLTALQGIAETNAQTAGNTQPVSPEPANLTPALSGFTP